MILYHVLSEAMLYQGKPLDLSNRLINSRYLENLVVIEYNAANDSMWSDAFY